jgi:hypothetical protein
LLETEILLPIAGGLETTAAYFFFFGFALGFALGFAFFLVAIKNSFL